MDENQKEIFELGDAAASRVKTWGVAIVVLVALAVLVAVLVRGC